MVNEPLDELQPVPRAEQIVADEFRAGTQRTAGHRFVALVVRGTIHGKTDLVARLRVRACPRHRMRNARAWIDEDNERAGIIADVMGDPACLREQLSAIANADDARIDRRQHVQTPGQALDARLGCALCPSHCHVMKSALHGRSKPREVGLENVVDRAGL